MTEVAVLFGTSNPGKLRELRRMVAGLSLRVLGPEELPEPLPEVVEDGATFEENAQKKATVWARWSGLLTLADDSGLCVDALSGAPGVHSARWSELGPALRPSSSVCELCEAASAELGPEAGRAARDERNNDKLLRQLQGVPDALRGAEYRAALCLARPDGSVLASVVGCCRGRIGQARRGTGGFGYDPLFVTGLAGGGRGRTMAELGPEEKDAISHRGEAFRSLFPVLAGLARAP
ncbi:MAG TPA: non-canonical purine NTP pyrophosphatase [Anaeromyxobacter sp.]|nr:non-canonical purine NTP pyrophosphatase [Anaeromyxobacter sp.]